MEYPAAGETWWGMERLRSRRRISEALDEMCGIHRGAVDIHLAIVELDNHHSPGRDVDYWGAATGMNLGMPERRAAGLAMLGQAA